MHAGLPRLFASEHDPVLLFTKAAVYELSRRSVSVNRPANADFASRITLDGKHLGSWSCQILGKGDFKMTPENGKYIVQKREPSEPASEDSSRVQRDLNLDSGSSPLDAHVDGVVREFRSMIQNIDRLYEIQERPVG